MSTELLREHVVRGLSEIENTVNERGDANHDLAAARADKLEDQVLASFVREESAPGYIRERIDAIRASLAVGQVELAYRQLATLSLRLDAISRIVRGPFLRTGLKTRTLLDSRRNASNEAKKRSAASIHADWQILADQIWERKPQLSKAAVARIIRTDLKLETKADTIRKAIKKLASLG